jgi:hypothetical protein
MLTDDCVITSSSAELIAACKAKFNTRYMLTLARGRSVGF